MKKLNNKGFAISTVIYGTFILFIMILAILLATMNSSLRLLDGRVNTVNNYEVKEGFYDPKDGAEFPDLSTGLIPVKHNGVGWVVADIYNEEWYNYNKQMWANAVSIDESQRHKYVKLDGTLIVNRDDGTPNLISTDEMLAMFVWIPRYSYTIGCSSSSSCFGKGGSSSYNPGAIDIKFVKKDSPIDNYQEKPSYDLSKEPSNWYTHPAFWWDDNNDGERATDGSEELSGIWVGKFQTTVHENSACYDCNVKDTCKNIIDNLISKCNPDSEGFFPTILPGAVVITGQNVNNQFISAKMFTENGDDYGIVGDSHMMKNSEYAAILYLFQSKYGKYGEGKGAITEKKDDNNTNGEFYSDDMNYYTKSSSGNLYGVYDMNGGCHTVVMGLCYDPNEGSMSSSGFSSMPQKKYYDNYCINMDSPIGHATTETDGWWGGKSSLDLGKLDTKYMFYLRNYTTDSFFAASVLADYSKGNATYLNAFRVTLVKP